MYHLDLCSGIGGFALASQWAGYTTIGFCEIDPWCRRVLAKNFPGVPQHDDLKTLTAGTVRGWIGERNRDALDVSYAYRGSSNGRAEPGKRRSDRDTVCRHERLDLITAGYPCQPFSLAGQRMGAEDDRHLWPHIAALVADLQPRRCLFENVYGHVSMGLDAVLSDLEALGYACGAVVVPACAVGAPHRRDRVWILADAKSIPEREPADQTNPVADRRDARTFAGGRGGDVSDPTRHLRRASGHERSIASVGTSRGERGDGDETLSGMGDETARLSDWMVGPERRDPWAGDWEAGCPRVTAHEADRTHKLKALGNAVVPQIPYEILRMWNEVSNG